jgi:hypothetical protein
MAEDWNGNEVPRNRIGAFTCGNLKPKTLANLDCLGQGPRGKRDFGRRVTYEKWPLAFWVYQRYFADPKTRGKTPEDLIRERGEKTGAR